MTTRVVDDDGDGGDWLRDKPLPALAPTPPPVVAPEKPKMTLAMLLTAMQNLDEVATLDFDPKELVGDLKDKVDAIKHVIDRLDFQEEWCRQQAEPFMRAAYALKKNVGRLKDYVAFEMQQGKYAELPGNVFRVALQNNPPALELTKPEADAADYSKYPVYVKQVRFYQWDGDAIKSALKDGAELPFAKLTVGKHCRFYMKPPDGVKKRGQR